VFDYRRGLDWWIDLLTTYTHHSELQAVTTPPLISTIHKSPQHPLSLFPASCVITSRFLATASDSEDSSAQCSLRYCPANIPHLFSASLVELKSQLTQSESKSNLLCDWRFTASQFVLMSSPWSPTTRDFFYLNPSGNSPYLTSSLTRRWVCRLWICLAFRQMYVSHIPV
jgi:hypothetical protein